MNAKTENKRTCFSIGSFSPEGHRLNMKILIDSFCEKVNLVHDYFWDQSSPIMDERIFNKLVTADLVIADLSGLNPNVMYEVGVRHAFNGKIIHLIPNTDSRPWDIDKNFILPYNPPIELHHFDKLVSELCTLFKTIDAIEDSKPRNSLINHVRRNAKDSEVFKHLKEVPSTDKALINLIQELSNDVKELKSQQNPYTHIIPTSTIWNTNIDNEELNKNIKIIWDTSKATSSEWMIHPKTGKLTENKKDSDKDKKDKKE